MEYAQTLTNEHVDFSRALDDCIREADFIRKRHKVNREVVVAILTTFFGPVGEGHVEREKILFKEVTKSSPHAAADVSTAISNTALGRNHLRRVAHYLETAAGGDPASLAEVAENLLEAEKTLRAEIELEDTRLMPLLSPLDADRTCDDVTRELEEIDRRQRKALPHINCRRIASVLWA